MLGTSILAPFAHEGGAVRRRRGLSHVQRNREYKITLMQDKLYNAALTSRARELRKNATKQENRLWYEYLRDFRPRFTRQRIVGSYIIDFYCGAVKVAVELDGSQHYEAAAIEYDNSRTRFLESLGIRVIRFTNIDVDKNFDYVCNSITNQVYAVLGQPPPSADGTPFVREGGKEGHS